MTSLPLVPLLSRLETDLVTPEGDARVLKGPPADVIVTGKPVRAGTTHRLNPHPHARRWVD